LPAGSKGSSFELIADPRLYARTARRRIALRPRERGPQDAISP